MTEDEKATLKVMVGAMRALGEAAHLSMNAMQRALAGADVILIEMEKMVGRPTNGDDSKTGGGVL